MRSHQSRRKSSVLSRLCDHFKSRAKCSEDAIWLSLSKQWLNGRAQQLNLLTRTERKQNVMKRQHSNMFIFMSVVYAGLLHFGKHGYLLLWNMCTIQVQRLILWSFVKGTPFQIFELRCYAISTEDQRGGSQVNWKNTKMIISLPLLSQLFLKYAYTVEILIHQFTCMKVFSGTLPILLNFWKTILSMNLI